MNVNGHEIKPYADLIGADLIGADLIGADLTDANLIGANLAGANLAGADLTYANLAGAYLTDAYLTDANLTDANLTDAYLARANLARANLAGANLAGADLTDAYLTGANLTDATLPPYSILPAGELVGWKAAQNGVIVELRIPADAARSNAPGRRKCRADRAVVAAMTRHGKVALTSRQPVDIAYSQHDRSFTYRVGDTVTPVGAPFDPLPQNECAPGIHFFITRAEAEAWL